MIRTSVIIPVRNGSAYVAAAVNSALPQLSAHDELIVVDDASSDGTSLVAHSAAQAMAAGDDSRSGILSDPLGPLWYRGLVTTDADALAERAAAKPPLPPLTQEQELAGVLAAYGARRLVIAHTPSLQGIQITNGGRLARIDTGISRYYGGPLSWLEIVRDQMIPHTVPRSP